MLAEVAAACERLDAGNYNADALTHLEDYLLTAGLEDEALRLIERFLPILRDQTASGDLMPWAAPIAESRLFDLRLGAAIRADSAAGVAPENLAAALLDGLEEEFDANAAAIAAAAVIDGNAPTAWSREHFDLAASTSKESKVRAVDLALIGVAKEAWQIERISPGCVLVGLGVLLAGAGEPPRKSSGKKKKKQRNLLSFLAPSGIEKRVVAECRDLMRINVPKARLLLDAHDTLRRFAARHGLIPEAESAATKKELTRLRQAIQGDA